MTVYACERCRKIPLGSRLFSSHDYGCPGCGACFCEHCALEMELTCPCGASLRKDQFFPRHTKIPRDNLTTRADRDARLRKAEQSPLAARDLRRVETARKVSHAMILGHCSAQWLVDDLLHRLITPENVLAITDIVPLDVRNVLLKLSKQYFDAHQAERPMKVWFLNGDTLEIDSGTEFGIAMIRLWQRNGTGEWPAC